MGENLIVGRDRLAGGAKSQPDSRRGVGGGVALGQFPQAAEEPLRAAARQQDLVVALHPQGDPIEERQIGSGAPGRHHRQLVLAAIGARAAQRGQRAR